MKLAREPQGRKGKNDTLPPSGVFDAGIVQKGVLPGGGQGTGFGGAEEAERGRLAGVGVGVGDEGEERSGKSLGERLKLRFGIVLMCDEGMWPEK